MRANEWAEFLPKLNNWEIYLFVPGVTGVHADFGAMAMEGFTLQKRPDGLLIRGPSSKSELRSTQARRIALREKIAGLRVDIGCLEVELVEAGG